MSTPTADDRWKPPEDCCEQQRAGVAWDAVRAPAYLGDQAMQLLGNQQGAVIRAPYQNFLYWLVPVDSVETWEQVDPAVEVFGTACWIDVPPLGRDHGYGPYWLREPHGDRLLTDPALLRKALATVASERFGPREESDR